MKLLTFAIPSYNSQDYMEHCIQSLLPGGDDVEILVVDDGSKDRTAEIADEYVRFIRKTADMERLSMPESVMPQDCFLRLWTVMTGLTMKHT